MCRMTPEAVECCCLYNAVAYGLTVESYHKTHLFAIEQINLANSVPPDPPHIWRPISIFEDDRDSIRPDLPVIPTDPATELTTIEAAATTAAAFDYLDRDDLAQSQLSSDLYDFAMMLELGLDYTPNCMIEPVSSPFNDPETYDDSSLIVSTPSIFDSHYEEFTPYDQRTSPMEVCAHHINLVLEYIKNIDDGHYIPPASNAEFLKPNSKSEPVLSCESPKTQSVALSQDLQRSRRQTRSQEKRNHKLSKAYLSDILERQRLEKRLTRLRNSQRRCKATRWELEYPSKVVTSHNNRRLEKFLELKQELTAPEEIHANGLLKKIFVKCCAQKDDPVYMFLTVKCRLDEMTAMALTPVIKGIKNILTNKITVAVALSALSYYLAKFVNLPVIVFAPIIALILGYLIQDIGPDVVDSVVKLYTTFSEAYLKLQEDVTHITDVDIDQDTFKFVDRETIDYCLIILSENPRGDWKVNIIAYAEHHIITPKKPFKMQIPNYLYDFLLKIDNTKYEPRFLGDLKQSIKPNGLTDFCINITDGIQTLFSSVGLISKTLTLPSAIYFYTSTKKFLHQIYQMIQDIYPYIYEFITGKNYVPPEVAKYLKVFGDIATEVHQTLKTSRQSNIVKENAEFRLKIVLQYEKLLESQMKLLEMRAPPMYMIPVNNLIREMSTLANECYSRVRGEAARDEPTLIFLRGPPGVGKTTVDYALALIIAERLGLKIDIRTDFFQREAGVEHWDGYENQMFVTLDDAFQLTDPVKQASTILEVIKCKNTAPYKLTMAALEAKKNSFFNSKFIFISTNVENVVCDQVADIGAFFRRIDFDVVVNNRPPPNADGTLSFDYNMRVNGKPCTIPLLADSIVALHKARSASDQNVAQALARYAKTVPPSAVSDLIAARESQKDFYGKDHSLYKPNGLIEYVSSKLPSHPRDWSLLNLKKTCVDSYYNFVMKTIDYNKPLAACIVTQVNCIRIYKEYESYLHWLAVFAITWMSVSLLKNLFKSLTNSLFPNSRKSKDKLTGDKKTQVQTKSTVKDQLKAAQAQIDKTAVKMVKNKPKANSSSTRWSQAMISYIKEQGWAHEQWVADSIASIEFLEDFECTPQERSDLDRLRSNTVEISTYYKYNNEILKMYGKALILNQNHLVTPSHQMPENCEILNVEINIQGKIVNAKNCKVDRIENSDTCIVTLATILPHRDISYMFAPLSEITASDSQEIYLLRNFDEVMTICPTTDFKPLDRQISYKTDYNLLINCGSVFETKVAVCPGDSGCFYVARDHGRFRIVGMHIASSSVRSHARFISREMLKNYISPPRKAVTPYDNVKAVLSENSRSFDHQLASNSNCIPIGVVEPRTMIASRSKIQRSILYKHALLGTLTEFPAILKRTYDEKDPLLKANSKFRLRDEPHIDVALRNEIIRALLDEHPNTNVKEFYSNLQALEGTIDMPHLNMTTSSGYPYSAVGKTPKTKLEESDWKEICEQTDDLLEDLYQGIVPQSIFQTSFKDETRKEPKIYDPRVINCAATKLTLLFRRVLGPWMNMVHANHNTIRTKVGINAHGDDWKLFFDRLCAVSPTNIVELDYSGYEYNHPQFGFQISADFIYLLYKRSGFSERDASAARLLILSCCGGYVIQNDVLIYVWMLLSGLPITAELNSLLNEIYQMIAYKKLTNLELISMRENVESGYYGDDLIHAVHDEVAQQFNALTVQKFCHEFLSMKVTPAANKGGDMPKFISILECSFLCRKFAPRENRVDAPIDLNTSINSLQYYIPVSHMTQRELIASKCRSFITELTHYPPEIYDHWLGILSTLKSEFNLDFIPYDYPAALAKRVVMTETR
jgi:hypothetical protein